MTSTIPSSRDQKLTPAVLNYFPFKPRPGQALMSNEVYYAILSHRNIAIEGAAGMGKTVTALSALLPICKEENLVLLYAARTHTQISRVIEELQAINQIKGHEFSAISLYGRANMCMHEMVQEARPIEAMELCRLLRKEHTCVWYENLQTREIDEAIGCFTADFLKQFAQKEQICPYYLGKELLPYCNVIALTYSYLVNPSIRPILFKGIKRDMEDCILVFDECHNVPEFAMDVESKHISDRSFERAIGEYHHYDAQGRYPAVARIIACFQEYLETMRAGFGQIQEDLEIAVDKKGLLNVLNKFIQEESVDLYVLATSMKNFGWQVKQQRIKAKQQPYSSVGHFGEFLEHFLTTFNSPKYLHYYIISKQNHIYFHIRCIDCRQVLFPLQKARGIVSMSGTLDPIDAYLDICGFPSQTQKNVLPSPFDHRNVAVFATRKLNVSYYERTKARYQLLAERCIEAIQATPGNSAIFCASYEVLEGLLQASIEQDLALLGRPFYYETRDTSSAENRTMVEQFKADGHQGRKAVLAGVCGGRNSEGVDYPGDELLTVIILGIPLARMFHSINALIAYYTEQFGIFKGKDYAYYLPAFRRANQAAGRPIRRLTDYGVIVLMDDRYTWPSYRRFLSHWLNENMITVSGTTDGALRDEVAHFFTNICPKGQENLNRMVR